MSYPLGKLHQISFTAPITKLISVIDVSSTKEGCWANPEHVSIHKENVLVCALLVYASYHSLSLLLFNLIQSLLHLHATKSHAAKSEHNFVQTFSGIICRWLHTRTREGIKNINTSILNLTLKLKSFNQIKHISRSCPWAWKWPSFHLKEN